MCRFTVFMAALVIVVLATATAALPAFGAADDLPANQWVAVPAAAGGPRPYNDLIYSPDQGQVLCWDWSASTRQGAMFGFDAAKGQWVPEGISPVIGEKADEKTSRLLLVSHGACWDSRRKEVIYTMPDRMAAYHPESKKWRELKPKTVLEGWGGPSLLADHFYEAPALRVDAEQLGPPPCYGLSTCYDPVNDEILLFPHFGAVNLDMVEVHGNISGHLGTLIYSFQDSTWRRVGRTFGTEEVRKARRDLLELIGRVSKATDAAWALRHSKASQAGNARPEEVVRAFAGAATALDALPVSGKAKTTLVKAGPPLREAATAAADGNWDQALAAGGRALWVFDEALDRPLRVEPPPRCGTPLIYDPKNRVIVMFGGHSGLVRRDLAAPADGDGGPGRLNDTWLYDCRTRQWRDVSSQHRPPPTLWPKLVYDPASGLVLLATWEAKMWDQPASRTVTLWGFDVAKSEWRQLDRQPWPGPLDMTRHGAILAEIALDQRVGLLVLSQQPEFGRERSQTCVLRLDVSKMTPKPALLWTEPEPLRPHVVPPDDPAVVAKLKALPANRWVHMRPPGEASDRGWGNAACDPVRGHVYYFGGGHSSYQVNDVAIYAPGVNRWFHAAGEHNDWIPPSYWDGTCTGLRGGPPAGHQRNYYCVVDGRMYASTGAESRRFGAESAKQPGRRYSWFYDLDCGGVWRRLPVELAKDSTVPGAYGKANMASPDGRILGFGGGLEPYNGRFFPGEVYFNSLDMLTSTLVVKKVGSGPPCCPGEDRPFCFLAGKDQVFYYEYAGDKAKAERQGTWVYDVRSNTFIDLKPKRHPPGSPRTVESIDGQDAVFAVIGDGQQWVYSFKHNTWAPLPLETDAGMGFASPYAQVVYSAKYRVLVNVGANSRGTAVMRPDVNQIKWE